MAGKFSRIVINVMMKCVTVILIFLCGIGVPTADAQLLVKKQLTKMGSLFDITVVDRDSTQALQYIDKAAAEIERIENLISEWRPHTQISEVNRCAGIRPVKVDDEVFELTRRAIHYSQLTDGAFDISIAALDKVWVFDGSMDRLPSDEAIRRSVKRVGYRHIVLDTVKKTIFLEKKGMKIGFGSIGKGYAADKGRELLRALGVRGGIVNASGDLSAWGTQPDGQPWKIGVRNPFKAYDVSRILHITFNSVATSGNNEKFAEIDGKRYAHIINPKTGWPSSELASVTVSGPSAEFANFLSTSIMVLGSREGKRLLKQFPEYRAIIVKDKRRR
ncbi:thiamine biosynthesis lipoprotein [Sphingobacterium allocomposti]|jgi:thiamine biosynthesis lipoprotein|uniref:FAD:protein FMN transferase n=1 Tax=Sphingobacterium allocomposti TaxID=415956 RepID=A0A5S5D6Z1_9SPHI|nr:FAD:protein FMN transferase [Sphingobacterium composti Yoo et al. 2007 non Ten et al. 2007]TYP91833.1 thiamine biosynthesis lipoprotein [Sphingobacterium composti Yoo et al. 2007 non Ten et al. 2007]HLS95676.1 FAD:protein FMN transferase [Sphingobacterium sp.]